ncbi:manganese-binding transcriptional regulator MntR [Alphaproteobacteria bacterium]|nr:manganese-binding transcriptional regulator MntR [Alphaproteobacteria bacterium]
MSYNNNSNSDRFFQVRNARHTEIAEDYTEMIADLIKDTGEARVVDLAERFGVTSPTVNSIIRRLVRDGFVESKPYRSIFLTDKGKKLAEFSKRRHEIVFNFLIALGVDLEIAKNDAEGIEHHVSSETLKVFEKFVKKNKLFI